MPLQQPPGKPKYYQAVGQADNLHSPAAILNGTRLPFAAHHPQAPQPELMADGIYPRRSMSPERPPAPRPSFSGRPVSHRLYYSGR